MLRACSLHVLAEKARAVPLERPVAVCLTERFAVIAGAERALCWDLQGNSVTEISFGCTCVDVVYSSASCIVIVLDDGYRYVSLPHGGSVTTQRKPPRTLDNTSAVSWKKKGCVLRYKAHELDLHELCPGLPEKVKIYEIEVSEGDDGLLIGTNVGVFFVSPSSSQVDESTSFGGPLLCVTRGKCAQFYPLQQGSSEKEKAAAALCGTAPAPHVVEWDAAQRLCIYCCGVFVHVLCLEKGYLRTRQSICLSMGSGGGSNMGAIRDHTAGVRSAVWWNGLPLLLTREKKVLCIMLVTGKVVELGTAKGSGVDRIEGISEGHITLKNTADGVWEKIPLRTAHARLLLDSIEC